MSLHREAWESFRANIKKHGWSLSVDAIIAKMDRHLNDARQKAKEYPKKMRGEIILCCGHSVQNLDEIIYLAYKDFIVDRGDMEHGGGMGEVSGSYCKDCAEKYIPRLGAWVV